MNNDEYFALVLENDTDIQHFGIKGQKWGIRRYQNEDGTLTALGKKREQQLRAAGDSIKKVAKTAGNAIKTASHNYAVKHKPAKLMTDDELRAKVQRLQLEKQYKELKSKKMSKMLKEVGQNAVQRLLSNIANNFVDGLTTPKKLNVSDYDNYEENDLRKLDPKTIENLNDAEKNINAILSRREERKKKNS